jgi:hypothetical protein
MLLSSLGKTQHTSLNVPLDHDGVPSWSRGISPSHMLPKDLQGTAFLDLF